MVFAPAGRPKRAGEKKRYHFPEIPVRTYIESENCVSRQTFLDWIQKYYLLDVAFLITILLLSDVYKGIYL